MTFDQWTAVNYWAGGSMIEENTGISKSLLLFCFNYFIILFWIINTYYDVIYKVRIIFSDKLSFNWYLTKCMHQFVNYNFLYI